MLIAFAVSLVLAGATSAQSASVQRHSANFFDNEQRTFVFHAHRQREEARRQAVIDHRMALATQLDALIGAGNCRRAEEVAVRYGYSDIVEQVAIACEARTNAPREQQQFD